MERKRCEYFVGGTSLVWEVDPERRRVRVYAVPEQYSEFFEEAQLGGGAVLPGFVRPVRAWFNEAGRQSERK